MTNVPHGIAFVRSLVLHIHWTKALGVNMIWMIEMHIWMGNLAFLDGDPTIHITFYLLLAYRRLGRKACS